MSMTRSLAWVVIAAILFACCGAGIWPSSAASLDDQQIVLPSPTPMLIRPVVVSEEEDLDGTFTASIGSTVRIVGRNGLCVDVKDGLYNESNPVQLWPCKTNSDPNQLWSLESDGTIRSNGKCLTTNGSKAGNYVVIYSCETAVRAATIWEVWGNGTIVNPESGLVLTATSGGSRTTLTVETNNYALSQGWSATNVTDPPVASIVGLRGLCLGTNGSAVWVEGCSAESPDQKWALYGDGSIRPSTTRDSCLTADQLTKSSIIGVSSCGPASAAQRWFFTANGTILNLYTGLVVDVKESDPSLKKIIIYPPTGNANQRWLPLF